MPLPKRIQEKRSLDPIALMDHAASYLAVNCEDDSLEDSIKILLIARLLCAPWFQSQFMVFRFNKETRQKIETLYMRTMTHG